MNSYNKTTKNGQILIRLIQIYIHANYCVSFGKFQDFPDSQKKKKVMCVIFQKSSVQYLSKNLGALSMKAICTV